MKNKKGVSEMVSYVLLVVIAIGLSILVYTYLKLYLPAETPECSEDISLFINYALCDRTADEEQLSVEISNNGLFNVSAAFIRFGEAERKVLPQINIDKENLYFFSPGAQTLYTFVVTLTSETDYIVEVQPAVIAEDRTLVLCDAIVRHPVTCP